MMKKLAPMILICLIFITACHDNDNEAYEATVPETETIVESSSETTESEVYTENETTTTEETTRSETKPEIIIEVSEETSQETEVTENEGAHDIELLDFFIKPDDTSRPIAIMIDNEGYKSYPQGGIEKAQVIYELIAEWGETRLVALFYGIDAGRVGPVRSIRHYFIQFAMEYDPVLVHIGYSPQAQTMLKNNGISTINGLFGAHYSVFFDITDESDNWQDTYTKFEYLNRHISSLGYRTEPDKGFPFIYSDEYLEGRKAESIYIEYSRSYNVRYEYDSATGSYIRYRKGICHVERYTGKVLTARNIIIQKVVTYPIANDTSGRMTMDNVGSGEGYIISNGVCRDITWEKSSDFSQTSYRYADSGTEITLREGQTWIMVISDKAKISID